MTAEQGEHYRAYKPRPFSRAERGDTTVLFGGLTWRHEALLQAALANLGYKAATLPNISRRDLDTGKELIDAGACCPTTFTTGNLINHLRSESGRIGRDEVLRRYVYVTAGACGACRFGQYHASYEMALRNTGLGDFRIFLMAQDRLDQSNLTGGGLEMSLSFTLGCLWAVLLADLVTDLEYMTRPYEVVPGRTDEVVRDAIDYLGDVLRERPLRAKKWGAVAWHLTTGYFTRALAEVKKKFETIDVDRLRPRARVAITGEFWLQTHEGDGNYNIKRWLEQEGAHVIPPPVAMWLDYWLTWSRITLEQELGIGRFVRPKMAAMRSLQALYRWCYDRLRRSLADLPHELPDQDELRDLAAPYYHHHLSGGEGFMMVGKALYYCLRGKAHMVCELSPYSCLPNTMAVGSMAGVLGKHPDLLYAPIEVKGDTDVHALSRCQMILTEAKQRAAREFEATLEHTGLTVEGIRAYERAHPELTRATYRVPHHGLAGAAANYVLHLAAGGLRGRRPLHRGARPVGATG